MARNRRKTTGGGSWGAKRGVAGRSLRLESLEDRRLLAITVDTLIDEDDGIAIGGISLRDAIAAAMPGETIDFSVAGAITLENGELVIDKALTINGPGANLLTIDAGGGSRIFNVDDSDSENLNDVTISGLTLTGGYGLGGGGAIFSQEKLLLTDSVVTGSEAQWGGGLYNTNDGEMTVLRTTLSGNTALSPSPPAQSSGGGIYNWGGILKIYESTISGNMAPDAAGIHNVNGGQLDIVDSTISGNFADFGGGGLRNDGSHAFILNSTVSGNAAEYGAGINNAYDGTLFVENSTISGNTANNSGGGIRSGDGYVSILSSTLSGNEATYGGGLYVGTLQSAPTIVRNSTISNNSAPQGGGGIYNFLGHVIIEFSTITENDSDDSLGSGVETWGDALLTLTEVHSSIIAGNHHTDVAVAGESNTFQSNGYNLIGLGAAGSAFTATGDQMGVSNPLLGPLADNGGPTMTHALLPGSPAIDAGDPTAVSGENGVPLYDQRGVPFDRVRDGNAPEDIDIDIGAFEVQQLDPPPDLVGDYNGDGIVDAADYTVWRDTLGSTADLRANGDDSNNEIDQDDYEVWAAHFGETLVLGARNEGRGARAAVASDLQSPAIARSMGNPARASSSHAQARMLALLDLLDSLPERRAESERIEWNFADEKQREPSAREEAFTTYFASEWP